MDESQLEVSKSLVKFKMFVTKEEAQEFRESQENIWSEVAESPKGGYFVAYSRPGELAAIAAKSAGEHYKLKVPLAAEYVVGRNWAECH
jgi:hypothetical protein